MNPSLPVCSPQLSKGDAALSTPRINQVLAEFRQRSVSGETRAPPTAAAPADRVNEQRIRKLEHQVSQLFHQVLILTCIRLFGCP